MMRRTISPVQYIRGHPSEKSFSMSSLSDCSLGKSPKRYSPEHVGGGSRGKKFRFGQQYRNDNYGKFDKGYESNRSSGRSRSIENQKRSFKNRKSPINNRKPNSSMVSTSHKKISLNHDQKHKDSEMNRNIKEKTKPDERLQRLEQMVQLLVNNKSQNSERPGSSATSQYEFNPRNTSFTTSVWLNKINNECIERNFGETECIQYIQRKMTGLMKAWFKTLDLFDYTWPEIKMLIINTFPDNVDFAATLRLLINRFKKPEETITQFYFSKMYLLEACTITGANAVSVLIDGLNDVGWQQSAKGQNFQNPEVFYTEFLSKLPNFGLQQMPQEGFQQVLVMEQTHDLPTQYEIADRSYRRSRDHPTEPIKDLRNNIGLSRLEKQSRKKHEWDTKRKCYICSGYGHLAAKCPNSGKCFLCNKSGHIAARCPGASSIDPY